LPQRLKTATGTGFTFHLQTPKQTTCCGAKRGV